MDELEIVQYQQVSGLSVFVNTITYRSAHFHKDWELLWVLDAPLTVSCMQRQFVVSPGEVVIFPPNTTHELRYQDQVCTFLWRAKGCPEPTTTVNPFTDIKESDYYYKAILWAVEEGVTGGYSDSTFRPNNVCTRGNIVTFLFRAEQ